MKLVRYGRAGAESPGLIDADGKLRDLSRVVEDITPEALTPAGLKRLRAAEAGAAAAGEAASPGSAARSPASARSSASG